MPFNTYCTLSDLALEGFDITPPNDALLTRRILQASEFIESVTGRWFGALERVLRVDGTGRRVLPVGQTIVQIDDIKIIYESTAAFDPSVVLDVDAVRVYNRHLTMGLLEPDDRDAPRLEIEAFTGSGGAYLWHWPAGSLNIELTGWFGYTELQPSDSIGQNPADSQKPISKGSIPEEVKVLCILLVRKNQQRYNDVNPMSPATQASLWPVQELKTRDQSVKYNNNAGGGAGARPSFLTGDPEIDALLLKYRRPARMALLGDPRALRYDAWA